MSKIYLTGDYGFLKYCVDCEHLESYAETDRSPLKIRVICDIKKCVKDSDDKELKEAKARCFGIYKNENIPMWF